MNLAGNSDIMGANGTGTWALVKTSARAVGYAALALFLLFVAIMTYRYGGGFSDWKAVVVMLVMVWLSGLIAWMGFGDRIARLRGSGT